MSGGSYGYLYVNLELAFEEWVEPLEEMQQGIEELVGMTSGALRFEAFVDRYKQLLEDWRDIIPLAQAVEWVHSNDWGVDALKDTIARLDAKGPHKVVEEVSCSCGHDWPCPVIE